MEISTSAQVVLRQFLLKRLAESEQTVCQKSDIQKNATIFTSTQTR